MSKLCIFFIFFFEFFKTFVGRFLIGENISIWMSPFRFKSPCARDGGMWWIILQRWGDHIWSPGCREFFYHESYCDESVVMTIYEFQIFCDVSSGVGYAPIWEMGGVYPYMGTPQRRGFFGGLKLITPYYFCAFTITIFLTLSCTSILKIPSASRTRVSFLMQLLCGEVK